VAGVVEGGSVDVRGTQVRPVCCVPVFESSRGRSSFKGRAARSHIVEVLTVYGM